MKITEVIKECRMKSENCRTMAEENENGGFLRGRAHGYDECADLLEEAVREIREELDKVKADAENRAFTEEFRANAGAMVVMLEWVLGENKP